MSRIVKLNIGGKRFETTEMTLTRIPDSMLSRMIQQPNEVEKINQGQVLFIDRDGEYFNYMLDYLRSGDHMAIPQGTDLRGRLITEADFYQLSGLADLIKHASTLKVGDVVQLQDLEVARTYFASVVSKRAGSIYMCWICQANFEFSSGSFSSLLNACLTNNSNRRKFEILLGKICTIDGQCAKVSVAIGCV